MKLRNISAALAAAVTLTACSAANADITAKTADLYSVENAAGSASAEILARSASYGNGKTRKRPDRKNITKSKDTEDITESLFLTEYEGDDCLSEDISHAAETEGDVLAIGIGKNYLNCTVKYGKVALMEEESTSKVLYFQGISEGKDNIVISETGENGVVLTEYIVTVGKDLTVEVYIENLPYCVCEE